MTSHSSPFKLNLQSISTNPASETPIRRRESTNPSGLSQTKLFELLLNIQQHSKGTLEDSSFFRNTIVPMTHEDPSIKRILTLFHEIRTNGLDPELLKCINELSQKYILTSVI